MKIRLPLAAGALALLAVAVTGCAPTVAMEAAHDSTDKACAEVIAQLGINAPTASGLDRRTTNAQGTAAWGSNVDIELWCGVAVPAPTSTVPCVTVDGVDWLRDDKSAPKYYFTTYGRSPAVTVMVNASNKHADANQALSDVGVAVATIKSQHRCTTPLENLENGVPVSPTTKPTPVPTPTDTAKPVTK